MHIVGENPARMSYLGKAPRHLIQVARAQLAAHPGLWNEHRGRTAGDSPHREVDDIWLRYIEPGKPLVEGPHESVWYPGEDNVKACGDLCVWATMKVKGRALGGCLVTRIPAGKQVYPHADAGWHATRYDTKVAIMLAADNRQSFCFEDEQMYSSTGDVFTFDNAHLHWVLNPTEHARITLIATVRTKNENNQCLTESQPEP